MSARLTKFLHRAPGAILLAGLLLAIGVGAYAVSVPGKLAIGKGQVSGSESERARDALAAELSYEPGAAFVLVLNGEESITAPASAVAIETLVGQIEELPGTAGVLVGEPSADGLATTVSVFVPPGAETDQLEDLGGALSTQLDPGPLRLGVDGLTAIELAVRDVALDEAPELLLLSLPLLVLLLGGGLGWRMGAVAIVAAALAASISVALVGLAGALGEIAAIAVVPAALTSVLLALQIGIGLVYRYREEAVVLGTGREALEYSIHILGRSALVAAASAALVGVGLLLVPIEIVRSIAAALIAAAVVGPIVGLVVIGAGIARGAVGTADEALPMVTSEGSAEGAPRTFRYLLAISRARLRGLVAVLPLAATIALAIPILDYKAIGLQASELPPDRPAAQAESRLGGVAGAGAAGPLLIATDGPAQLPTVTIYRDAVSRVETVRSIGSAMTAGDLASFDAIADARPLSLGGQRAAKAVREVEAPNRALVGGASAELVDAADRIAEEGPLIGLLVLLAVALGWGILYRSTFAPMIALASAVAPVVGASTMLLLFEQGALSEPLDYTPAGAPHLYGVVLVSAVLGAVALARGGTFVTALREERVLGGGAPGSIARSGALTLWPALLATLAGVVLAGVWLGSELLAGKELAIGLSAGLIADLVLVRFLLAPALARLSMGSAR